MPRGDKTGPAGMGSMTGRGLGSCNGNDTAGFVRGMARGGFGRGFSCRGFGRNGFSGNGFGRGFLGFGNRFPPESENTASNEASYLENEIDALKRELKAMEGHLTDLKKTD